MNGPAYAPTSLELRRTCKACEATADSFRFLQSIFYNFKNQTFYPPSLKLRRTLSAKTGMPAEALAKAGGERGIRTLDAPFETYMISNHAPSTTQTSLLKALLFMSMQLLAIKRSMSIKYPNQLQDQKQAILLALFLLTFQFLLLQFHPLFFLVLPPLLFLFQPQQVNNVILH